jgi:hypothetical protein
MTRTSSIRPVFAIALLLALVAGPMAGALPVEKPEAVYPTASGWFGFALKWLEDLTGFRRPVPGHRDRSNSQSAQKGGQVTPTGTSCIDPAGNPRCGG